MKKIIITIIGFVLSISVFISIVFISKNQQLATNAVYLRIHIRANSDSEDDQNLKMRVKERIVAYLAEQLIVASSKANAIEIAKNQLDNICEIANQEIVNSGKTYFSNAKVQKEFFPTRQYGDENLKEGYYDALIVNLGTGAGTNWWCVIYPPLCFSFKNASTNHIQFKSIFEKS